MTTVTLPITLLVLLDLHVMSIVLGMDMDSTAAANTGESSTDGSTHSDGYALNTGESSMDGSTNSIDSTESIEDVKQWALKNLRRKSPSDLRRHKSRTEKQKPETDGELRVQTGTLQAINELLIEKKLVCYYSFIHFVIVFRHTPPY